MASPSYPPWPVFLNLRDRLCTVVGGGPIGAQKAAELLAAGALVRAVSPAFATTWDALTSTYGARLTRVERTFDEADVQGSRVVISATADAATDAAVEAAARATGALINVVDVPHRCEFYCGAIVRRGAVTVAIGTGGASPSLARALRLKIDATLAEAIGPIAELLGARRAELLERIPSFEQRGRRLNRLIEATVCGPTPTPLHELDARLERVMACTQPCPADGACCWERHARAGRVSLVGAGPGDPELLTLRAARRLAEADVVLFDHLVSDEVLGLCNPLAERIDVGKNPGAHAVPQQEIGALLVAHARRGRSVVRLKGGDPFVFGRGGEEALEVARAGLVVEVVPGVSSAVAGPAAAWIPVTHRGASTCFSVITATSADDDHTLIDSQLATLGRAGGTLVVLMGIGRIERVVSVLLESGVPETRPVAVIRMATTPDQETLSSTLGEVAQDVRRAGIRNPAVIVIGEVVALGDEIRSLLAVATANQTASADAKPTVAHVQV